MPEKTKSLETIFRKTPDASSPAQTAAPSVSPSGFDLAPIQRAAGNMAMQHAARETGSQNVPFQLEPHGQIQRFLTPLSMLGNVLSPAGALLSYGTAATAPAAAAATSQQRSPEQLRGMMETYLTYNTRNVWATVGEYMLSVQFPTSHARLTWVDHQAFVEKMLKQLESWIEFTKITQLDEILYPTNGAKTIGDLLPATRAWSVDVGIAIAHALHIAVVASLKRLAERYLAVADSQGLSGGVLVDDLVTSLPIDRYIAPALCAPHAVTVTALDPKAAEAAKGKPVGIKDVTLSPEGARDRRLWNWVRADSPSDATAEDVAAKIWRVTDQHGDTISSFSSYLLAAAPPLFGIPKRFAIKSSIFKQYAPADALTGEDSVETQLLAVANSTATDEVVLHGKPPSPPLPAGTKPVEPELPSILATFNDCAMQLAFLQKELEPWGFAARVNPAIAFVARKQVELVADPKRLGEWSVVANGQKDRLGRIAGGIHTLAVSALKLGVTDPSSPKAGPVRDILELFAVAAGASHLGQASEAKFLQGLDLQSGLNVRALQFTEVSMMGELQRIHEEAATMGELRKDEKNRTVLDSHMAELSHRALEAQVASRRLQARMLSGLDVDAEEFEDVSMQSEEVALESKLFGTLTALTNLNKTSISARKGDAAIIASMFSGEFRELPMLTKHLFEKIRPIRSNWYEPLKGFYQEEKFGLSPERRKQNRQTRRRLLTEAQKRFEKIAEERPLNEFFAHAAELIENQQFRTACVKVAAMIGISVIGGGIAGLAGRAVGGMLMEATGASTITDLSLVARASKFATQLSVDTTISAAGTSAIQGTSFTEAWKENLIVALGTSAVFGTIGRYVEEQAKLEGKIAATWASSSKLGKLFIVGKEVGALGVHTLWGVAIGSVAHKIVTGETQASPQGLRDWGLQFVSVTVGRHISERVTRRLKVYQALEQHFEGKGRGLVAAAKNLQALAKQVISRKSPAKALDLLEQHEAFLREEMEAVDEAIARTHGMADELYSARESLKLEQEAAGSEANLDTKFALLGLEELVPGALWKGSEHDINQAVAKAKQYDETATASRDETTGVWTIKVGERTIEVHQTDWTSSSKPGDTPPSEPEAPTVSRDPAAPAPPGPEGGADLDTSPARAPEAPAASQIKESPREPSSVAQKTRRRRTAKARRARLRQHFTTSDLQALDSRLAESGAVLNDEMVDALIERVPRGKMRDVLNAADLAAAGPQMGTEPDLGETGARVDKPRPRRGKDPVKVNRDLFDPDYVPQNTRPVPPGHELAEIDAGVALSEAFPEGTWVTLSRFKAPDAEPGTSLGETRPDWYNAELAMSVEVKKLHLAGLGIGPDGRVIANPSEASVEALARARGQFATRRQNLPGTGPGTRIGVGTEQSILFNVTGEGVTDMFAFGRQLRQLLKENLVEYDRVFVQNGRVLVEIP